MDIHHRIAAGLHIASGLLIVLLILIIGLFFTAFFGRNGDELFAGVGLAVAIPFMLMGAVQIGCAVMYLMGHTGLRIALVAYSILLLFVFPLGTAAGAYSLWALLVPRAQQ